jgi:ABC-type dipeptide/oligopeptide/nickel transport system permease component
MGGGSVWHASCFDSVSTYQWCACGPPEDAPRLPGKPAALMFIGRRIVGTVPSLLGVVVVTFLLSHALPGDPAAYFAGPAANADSIASVRASLGLDRPLPEQFLHYVLDLLHGNLGNSLTTGQPVLVDLAQRLPASL